MKSAWILLVALCASFVACSDAPAPASTDTTIESDSGTTLFDGGATKLDAAASDVKAADAGDGSQLDAAKLDTAKSDTAKTDTAVTDGALDSEGDTQVPLDAAKADADKADAADTIQTGCLTDSDCAASGGCTVGVCDKATGKCSTAAKPNCCTFGACCDLAKGTVQPAGTACGSDVLASEWACNGNQLRQRAATAACTGQGADACSSAAADVVWTPWSTVQTCTNGSTCEVKDKAQPGQCVGGTPPVPGQCTPGSTCCEADGKPSAKGKACSTFTLASEYKCDSAAAGGKMLVRTATPGCAGDTAKCSYDAASYAWSDWTVYKTCGATEGCVVNNVSYPGTCKSLVDCAPGSTCCDAAGKYAVKGTLCGDSTTTEFQCSGADIQARKQFGSCSGTSATCASWNPAWTAWATVSTCGAATTCKAANFKSDLPTCVAGAADLCKGGDPWEGPENTAGSFDLGTHQDDDDALWLAPVVALQSATDKDFFRYQIKDVAQFDKPEVYLNWSAAKPVTVCAWYRCSKGVNGKDCAAISCPWSAKSVANPDVSGVAANGCCVTQAQGTLQFSPDAAGQDDDSGEVFWSVENKDTNCQTVSVKYAFGGSTWPVCDPGTTCCTDVGKAAPVGTPCGSSQASEYRCSTGPSGPVVEKRDALRSCDGKSTMCPWSGDKVWSAWTLTEPCLGAEVCAIGLPSTPGTCQTPPPGTCAGACGGKGKDGTCYCDSMCASTGDCCKDFNPLCGGTCADSCGGTSKSGGCQCDPGCKAKGNCCLDYASKCP